MHALAGGLVAGAVAGIVGLVLTRSPERGRRDESRAGAAVKRKNDAVDFAAAARRGERGGAGGAAAGAAGAAKGDAAAARGSERGRGVDPLAPGAPGSRPGGGAPVVARAGASSGPGGSAPAAADDGGAGAGAGAGPSAKPAGVKDVLVSGISPFKKGLDTSRPVHLEAPASITGSATAHPLTRLSKP
jgi:hypothetical protein